MKIRYSLVPQMHDYDNMEQLWVPYLMYFNQPKYVSSAVNTDSKGFRITYKSGYRLSDFNYLEKWPVALLAGSSVCFGVGASHDRCTIASLLSSKTEFQWLNFSGRAFNSTQEMLLFMFYGHVISSRIKKVIILSGINNLILHYLSQFKSEEFFPIFFGRHYYESMNMHRKNKIARFLENIILFRQQPQIENNGIGNISCVTDSIKKDLSLWKLFSERFNFELYYVLQPCANWISRKLSEEEIKLFQELDNHKENQWEIIKNKFNFELYHSFSSALKNICNSFNIAFLDTNEYLQQMNLNDKWIFVDRVHLNDQGNEILSIILAEKLINK